MSEGGSDATLDLIVPIYLDTQALLDLLASLEDGFAMVERISSRSTSAQTLETSVAGEFGVANVLNLLRIGASASKSKGRADDSATERSQERYHTYGSLLHKLRQALDEEGVLQHAADAAVPGDFIELAGTFRPNPLAASLRAMNRLMDLFTALSGAGTQGRQKTKGDARSAQAGGNNIPRAREINQIRAMIEGILEDLEQGDIRMLVVDLRDAQKYKAVISLFVEYLRDQTMTELSYREFRLLGKVVGHVRQAGESIDLLRGTGIASAGDEALNMFEAAFTDAKASGLDLPGMERRISSPALEVLPIAIYV